MSSRLIGYIYTTRDGKSYPCDVFYKSIPTGEIVFDYDYVTSLCRKGCSNFNVGGGCPPKAPRFDELIPDYPYSVVICAKLLSAYKPIKVKNSNSFYIHYRFQDNILARLLTMLGNAIKQHWDEVYFLGNGYCSGCKKCNFKLGYDFCKQPDKRTFSMEATGIDVVQTLRKAFGVELQWYNKENFRQVEYMIKAIGILTKTNEQSQLVVRDLVDFLNQLDSTKYKIGTAAYENLLREYYHY